MIYLVGASCLYHLIHRKEHITERNWYHRISTSIPGLSVNYNTRKTVQDLLKNKLALRNRNRIVIWHDVINNCITEHKSNWCAAKNCYRPLNSNELVDTLKEINKNKQIEAIVYTRRQGTPDLSVTLRKTGILILEVTKNLIPKAQQTAKFLHEISQIHPKAPIEQEIVDKVIRNSRNLLKLVKKVRSKKKKPNKRQKDRIKKRNEAAKAGKSTSK